MGVGKRNLRKEEKAGARICGGEFLKASEKVASL